MAYLKMKSMVFFIKVWRTLCAGVSLETRPPKAGDCLLNLRVFSVDAALSSNRHSVLLPISERIG